jgi:hypothetical protein
VFAQSCGKGADEGCHLYWIGEQPIEVEPYPAVMAGLEREVSLTRMNELGDCREVGGAHYLGFVPVAAAAMARAIFSPPSTDGSIGLA